MKKEGQFCGGVACRLASVGSASTCQADVLVAWLGLVGLDLAYIC
jgi:hypothetical protein